MLVGMHCWGVYRGRIMNEGFEHVMSSSSSLGTSGVQLLPSESLTAWHYALLQ